MAAPMAPPIPIEIIDTTSAPIISNTLVTMPAAKPTNPAKAVLNRVIKIAATIPPNAPATLAFQKPLNAPSPTIIPTTKPASNRPNIFPYPGKTVPANPGNIKERKKPTITAPHSTI